MAGARPAGAAAQSSAIVSCCTRLFEHVSDQVALLDSRGETLYTNPSFLSARGCGGFLCGIHPDDIEEVRNALDGIAASGGDRQFGFRAGELVLEAHASRIAGETGILVLARDVTRQRQTQHEMALLAHLVAGTKDAICITDMENTILFVNPALVDVYGYAEGELIGRKADIFHSTATPAATLAQIVPGTMNGGWHGELINRKKDGLEFAAEVWTSLIRNDAGTPVAMVGVERDISGRRKTELELGNSERHYRQLVEQASVAIFIADRNGTIQFVNPFGCALLGYTEQEFTGMTIDDTYAPREAPQAAARREALGVGEETRFERIARRKDGTEFPVEVSLRRVEENRYQGMVHDLRERRTAEEQLLKLSRAVEQSPASIMITNTAGDIEYVNPKFMEVTGYGLEEVIGRNPRILKSGHTSPGEYADLWKTIREGNEWRGEFHNRRKGGELYWEVASISPIRNSRGEITHFLAVKEDVTEKKSLEQQFYRAQRLESLGTIAGGIAHDLNNVLAPILLAVQLLRKEFPSPQARKVIDTLETTATRGKEIVRQVLTFARGVEGEHSLIQPKHLVSEIMDIMRETFPKSIEVRKETGRDLWTVSGDLTQLHQILMNLCVNARDAMPDGGTLTLRAENLHLDEHYARLHPGSRPGPHVMFCVSDTGCGIPPGIIHRIFDPFFTTKGVGKGTGLGLASVHAIAKGHGGFVSVTSEVGRGTTFKVFIPASRSREQNQELQSRTPIPSGNGEMILIVDDEASILEISRNTLETFGYRVAAANDGAEAVARFEEHKDDIRVVVTDMMMPVMDGAATIRALRCIRPDITVIAASGLLTNNPEGGTPHFTADAFLQKPYTAETLLWAVHSALARGVPPAAPEVR